MNHFGLLGLGVMGLNTLKSFNYRTMLNPFKQRTVIATIVFLFMPLLFVLIGLPLDLDFVGYFGLTGAFSLLLISYIYYVYVGRKFEPEKAYALETDTEELFSIMPFIGLWAAAYFIIYAISLFPAYAFRTETLGLAAFAQFPTFLIELVIEKWFYILIGFLVSASIREIVKKTQELYTLEITETVKTVLVVATSILVSTIMVFTSIILFKLIGVIVLIPILAGFILIHMFDLRGN